MQIQQTSNLKSPPQIVAYGPAGSGKTKAIETAPKPLVLSLDRGLRSLKSANLAYVEITTEKQFVEALTAIESGKANQYKTICLDDLTELGDMILREKKPHHKDGRQAYYEMQDLMLAHIRRLRDLKTGQNLYLTAKLDRTRDAFGNLLYSPMLPGQALSQILPHLFDEVYFLQVYTDPNTNQIGRCFRTFQDGTYYAKSRCEKIAPYEAVDLNNLFAKIRS